MIAAKRLQGRVEPNSPDGPVKALCRSRQLAAVEALAAPPRKTGRGRPGRRRIA
jgi:hypothetical protein